MTFSILARDPSNGRFGVAVATCHLAVGSTVPHIRAGVGLSPPRPTQIRIWGFVVLSAWSRVRMPRAFWPAFLRMISTVTGVSFT